ncbi:MAG: RNA polymerase sigma factor region1.1 domain-containing protein, partial [Paracoccaceae bacterium]
MAAKESPERKQDVPDDEATLDMSQTAVKKMIADARERGYITYDQLNTVLPPDQVSSEQIED